MGGRGFDEESLESLESTSSSYSRPRRNSKGVSTSKTDAKGEPLRPIAGHTPSEVASGVIAGASIATSAAAMVLNPANIVFAAGGLSCEYPVQIHTGLFTPMLFQFCFCRPIN